MYEVFYRSLFRIRRVEEEVAKIYPSDKIKSPVHLSIGQEAVAAGVAAHLRPSDRVLGAHRSHGHFLALGGEPSALLGEVLGKATGCSSGMGGSMHLVDAAAGFMGTSAVVGTTIPHAVGYAYAMRLQRRETVVASFFGDGAVDEGIFSESLNFAALKRLPLIFICENNFYSIHSHQLARQPASNIVERARAYAIPADRIEDNDVLRIYDVVKRAAEAIRAGDEGGRKGLVLLGGIAVGIAGSIAAIPMSAFGVAFIGNIWALTMFGVGLLLRGYSAVLLPWLAPGEG